MINRIRAALVQQEGESPDMEAVRRGLLPWTTDEFWAVFQHEAKLRATPQDDWDRRPSSVTLEEDGEQRVYRFNPDVLLNQMMRWMTERYQEQPWVQAVSHMNRYLEIKSFVQEHQERLEDDGLLTRDGETQELTGIATVLIDVLVAAPYEEDRPDDPEFPHRTFDYDRVIARVREHIGDEDDADGFSSGFGDGFSL